MNQQAEIERRSHDAKRALFGAVGAPVEESFIDLTPSGCRTRVLSHRHGRALVPLDLVSLSAAAWAPFVAETPAVQAAGRGPPGDGLSAPTDFRRGQKPSTLAVARRHPQRTRARRRP